MEYPKVWIVVVHWNLRDVTLECLESLTNLQYHNYEIVVVDNGSTDDSYDAIQRQFPKLHQIRIQKNQGSTFGYNTGFKYALEAGAEYILLISNDTVIDSMALTCLVDECKQNGVGVTGPMIFYASAPEKIWSAGGDLSRLTLDLKGNHGRSGQYKSVIDRDFLTGCAMLIKRDVFETVGLMDEDFFLYHEELDYCLRINRAGFRLLLVPQAKVWHKVSLTSGGSWSPTVFYWMAHNSIIYYRKHAVWWQWFFIIPWRCGSAAKTSLILVANRRWKSLIEYWRGIGKGLRKELRQNHLAWRQNP